jgi:hypothetical protein
MARVARSRPIDVSDSALEAIVAALPPGAPPERAELLPAILRAWVREDLSKHLSREGRAAVRQREARLQAVNELAKALLQAVTALDERGSSEMALRPQMRRDRADIWNVNLATADRRRDRAISWLHDLVQAFDEPQLEPPPDTKAERYLVMLDLAAIFELVSGEPATRRTGPDTGVPYGPFWNFAKALWSAVYGSDRGLQNAMRIWADHTSSQAKLIQVEVAMAEEALGRPLDRECDRTIFEAIMRRFGSFSPFVANLQFRHGSLWRKLRGAPQ